MLRGMSAPFHPRITIEPGKCGGKPCIRGMLIQVSDALELLANGASREEILADYPCLARDHILPCYVMPFPAPAAVTSLCTSLPSGR